MEILSCLDHARSNKRHKVFPANQTADSANVSFVADQVGAIPRPPDCTFNEGGNSFTMTAENFSGALDKKEGVVDGVNASARIHFITSDNHMCVRTRGGVA